MCGEDEEDLAMGTANRIFMVNTGLASNPVHSIALQHVFQCNLYNLDHSIITFLPGQ